MILSLMQQQMIALWPTANPVPGLLDEPRLRQSINHSLTPSIDRPTGYVHPPPRASMHRCNTTYHWPRFDRVSCYIHT